MRKPVAARRGQLRDVAPGLSTQNFFDISYVNTELFSQGCIAQVLVDVLAQLFALFGRRPDFGHIERHELALRQIQSARHEFGSALLPLAAREAVL